jgi:predicted O-linked N-acetylglucosamine transferase (SPINDLY family)
VVFGSFNTLSKLQPAVLSTWRRILEAVPNSLLVLKAKALHSPEVANKYKRLLPAGRVLCLGMTPDTQSHFHVYEHIDVALDVWPYAGTTTTCEAMWNGVPVVTCRGTLHSASVSASLVKAVEQVELEEAVVAEGEEEYVEKAVRLAGNQSLLKKIKTNLKDWMRTSRLCDGRRHCSEMEMLLMDMWTSSMVHPSA